MAAVTLAQAAQLETQPLKKGVLLGLAREGIAADIFNFRDLGGRLQETGVRYDEVITPDWIAIGGSISSKAANAKPISFSVYQMALHVDVPKQIDEGAADAVARQFAQQVSLATKGAAYQLNDAVANGDQSTDINMPNGLRRLVQDLDSSQRIGSTEIDLTGSYTAALAESLWSRLDQAIYAVNGHKPDFALCNSTFLLKMESFSRQNQLRGNDFDWTSRPPSVGDARASLNTAATRPAFMYKGIPFYDLGVKSDQTTKIIGDTYTEGGSSAHATRIFFVKQGPEDFEALQFNPLTITNVGGAEDGTLEDTMTRRKRIDWAVGFAVWNPYSIALVQGVRAV